MDTLLYRAFAINYVTRSGRALAEPRLVEARAYVVTRALSLLLVDVPRKDVDQACLANKFFKHMYLGRLSLLVFVLHMSHDKKHKMH